MNGYTHPIFLGTGPGPLPRKRPRTLVLDLGSNTLYEDGREVFGNAEVFGPVARSPLERAMVRGLLRGVARGLRP